jgi:Fur family peroxide stress response transcriptional regulator
MEVITIFTARQALISQGLKVTPQRLAIYKALLATTAHPTVESIHEYLSADYPTMSLNTVYTTLKALTKAGLARRIDVGDSFRYDSNSLPHAHIVCTACHRVDDLLAHIDNTLKQLPGQAASASGFQVKDYSVYFYGICPQCQRDNKKGGRIK